jgi:hypothetical protein
VANLSGFTSNSHERTRTLPLDGTIGGLVGMLDVLWVECPICGRQAHYDVARLVAELGPGCRLTDWLHQLTLDCPQKRPGGPTQACGALTPDLVPDD